MMKVTLTSTLAISGGEDWQLPSTIFTLIVESVGLVVRPRDVDWRNEGRIAVTSYQGVAPASSSPPTKKCSAILPFCVQSPD